jgi:hypothetical protein
VPHWADIRDVAVFALGSGIAIHETLFRNFDRPGLLALAAAMMGLAALPRSIGTWEIRRRSNGSGNGPPRPPG